MVRFLKRFRSFRAPAVRRRPQQPQPRLEVLEDRLTPASFTRAQLDAAGQYMLELINSARADPTGTAARFGIDLNEGLAPGTISAAPKQPLAPNSALFQSLDAHLQFWLAHFVWPDNRNPHTGLGDGTPQSRAQAAGFDNPLGVGENLAWQSNSASMDLQATMDQMFRNLFVDSTVTGRGHRLNILNPQYQEIGSSAAAGLVPASSPQLAGQNLIMSGQDFGIPANTAPFLTGVVFQDSNSNGRYDIGEGLSGVTVTVTQGGKMVASTTTSDAGGYALQLAPGTYTVTFSGGGLSAPRSGTVTLAATNVEDDLAASTPAPPPPPSKVQAGSGVAIVGRNDEFVIATGGALWDHSGTNPNSGWTLLKSQGVTAVSVGIDAVGRDALFVNVGGTLLEHTGTNPNAGWSQVWTGVKSFSASQVQANTVFVSFGSDLWEHVGLDANSGWTKLAGSGVTGLDAGVDASHQAAVFANFGGTLWEHTGTNPNAGWSQVWTGVKSFSASQVQANTVFVSFGSDLWEHTGTSSSAGWSKIWGSGVTGFSAGVDSTGSAAVFVNLSGDLWEHTGTSSSTGWSEVWKSGVTGFTASQLQADKVFVAFGSSLDVHVGRSSTSGWELLV
jgi:hypothetical protein